MRSSGQAKSLKMQLESPSLSVIKNLMNQISNSSPSKERFFKFTTEALDFIESNLTEPISVKEVTENFEKSHWHFQRMFRSVVGISIGQYLRERRLTEAARMLKESDMRILDIAVQFEFGSQEAFSRSFKKSFSVAPSDYRENNNLVLREARKKITSDKLEYFWSNVQRTPDLIQMDQKFLVGMKVEFQSHFTEGTDCKTKVVDQWLNFLPKKKQIKNQLSKEVYGVALSSELDLREEKLSYLSATEVTRVEDPPEGMTSLVLPEGLYARFENRGATDQHSSLVDYIYGIWLPSSLYNRGLGYDFEIFDHRYDHQNENSISRFLIPVVLR